jgi:hypothetical protein
MAWICMNDPTPTTERWHHDEELQKESEVKKSKSTGL